MCSVEIWIEGLLTQKISLYIYIYIHTLHCNHLLLLEGFIGCIPCVTRSWCDCMFASRPTQARSCEGIHNRISLASFCLLLQKYSACLDRLVGFARFETGGSVAAVLSDAASRTCSREHTTFLCSFYEMQNNFFPVVFWMYL